MEVFKKLDDNRFACRYLSAEERGRLMGFPNGYITTANKALFHELSSAHKIRYAWSAFLADGHTSLTLSRH